MNITNKLQVMTLLETVLEREQKIAVLRYELAHPISISPDAMIEAMSLTHNNSTGRLSSHVSDKTAYIALNYQEKTDKVHADTVNEIAMDLFKLEQVQNRLKHYISLLEPRQAEVIQLLYIGRLTQKEVERALRLSAKTIRKLRNEAVDNLTEMYKCASGKC